MCYPLFYLKCNIALAIVFSGHDSVYAHPPAFFVNSRPGFRKELQGEIEALIRGTRLSMLILQVTS